MLTHTAIWQALDLLAEQNGLSPSGLARKAGLSPTAFNRSKRVFKGRERWPSTESVAAALRVTETAFAAFAALTNTDPIPGSDRPALPLADWADAGREGAFDDRGSPVGPVWDVMSLPGALDARAFAVVVSGRAGEPIYHEGDVLILTPTDKPRRGDRVIARTRSGEMTIGCLGREGSQRVEILSLRPEGLPVTLARRDVAWLARIAWASQ